MPLWEAELHHRFQRRGVHCTSGHAALRFRRNLMQIRKICRRSCRGDPSRSRSTYRSQIGRLDPPHHPSCHPEQPKGVEGSSHQFNLIHIENAKIPRLHADYGVIATGNHLLYSLRYVSLGMTDFRIVRLDGSALSRPVEGDRKSRPYILF